MTKTSEFQDCWPIREQRVCTLHMPPHKHIEVDFKSIELIDSMRLNVFRGKCILVIALSKQAIEYSTTRLISMAKQKIVCLQTPVTRNNLCHNRKENYENPEHFSSSLCNATRHVHTLKYIFIHMWMILQSVCVPENYQRFPSELKFN